MQTRLISGCAAIVSGLFIGACSTIYPGNGGGTARTPIGGPPSIGPSFPKLEKHEGPPPVVNFSVYDIEAIFPAYKADPDEENTVPLPVTACKRAVNFRYLKAGGVHGAIFRTSFIHKGLTFKTDRSFEAWAESAAANGVRLGAYHFFDTLRKTTASEQADRFIAGVRNQCRSSNLLRGRGILLVVDASIAHNKRNNESEAEYNAANVEHLNQLAEFIERVRRITDCYPGVYPENKLKNWLDDHTGEIPPATQMTLSKCWLWASRYSQKKPTLKTRLWNDWTLWQYSAGENWYPNHGLSYKKKVGVNKKGEPIWEEVEKLHVPWDPTRQPPEDMDRGWSWTTKDNSEFRTVPIAYDVVRFPIGVVGSAIPLEGNYFQGNNVELCAFWDRNAWVAYK
ncbi:MAG: GH25 family lysozyme [Fimbriimonadaceae bacterium]